MIDADHEERDAVGSGLAVLARASSDRELVRAEDVLRPEVARAQAINAAEEPRHHVGGDRRQPALVLQRLVQGSPDVAPHRIVARQRLVGPLEDDDVLLAGERRDDRGVRERPKDVGMDRSDLGAPALAHVVDRRLDVFRRRSQRHEHGVGIVGPVLADQPVVPPRQFTEDAVGVLEEIENRFDEVVAPAHDALHVVLLVFDRTQEDRIGEIDHPRHAAPPRTEEDALTFRRAVDDVVGPAEGTRGSTRLRACRRFARGATSGSRP